MVIERYKSGFNPPGDQPFEDLSKTGSINSGSGGPSDSTDGPIDPVYRGKNNHLTARGTQGAGKLKKRGGIFGIFSSNKVMKLILNKIDQ